ncbi:MAG: transcriptional regulator [Patescibacteria group bacterium]
MKSHLEHLFGSKTRIRLLPLFLFNPQREFYVRELTRKIGERINSVRRELDNLSKLNLLTSRSRDKRRYYRLNLNFILIKELKALISRATAWPQERLSREIKKIGRLKFACLSGFFTQSSSRCDLLLVGTVRRSGLERFIKRLEREQNHEINYTVMSEAEFNYRRDLDDRFLNIILNNEHIVLINEILKKQKSPTFRTRQLKK